MIQPCLITISLEGLFAQEVNQRTKGVIIPMVLELSSLTSVKKFAQEFKSLRIPIDIMILNAAIMMSPPGLTEDGVELQFGTNHLGHFLLVKLLSEQIKNSKTRIVHVSSLAHYLSYEEGISTKRLRSTDSYDPARAYGQSKLANVLFSNELANRYGEFGVTSNALHPGSIATDLTRHIPDTFGAKGLGLLKSVTDVLHSFTVWSFHKAVSMTAEDGALNQLYVATSPDASHYNGKYFHPVGKLTEPSFHCKNQTLATLLWDLSEDLVKDFA